MLTCTNTWVTLKSSIVLYDLNHQKILSTLPMGVAPYFPQRTLNGTKVLVPNYASNSVSILCTVSNRVLATLPVGIAPISVAIDPGNTTAYVTNSGNGTVSVLDIPHEKEVATISVGDGPVDALVSPVGSRVYVSNGGSGTLSVIDPHTRQVTETIPIGDSPHGLSVDSANTKLYVANSGSHNVRVFSLLNHDLLAIIPVGRCPMRMASHPVMPRIYVTNKDSDTITVISTDTDTVLAEIKVGHGPQGISVTDDGKQIYIANEGSRSISIINTQTNTVVAEVLTPVPPRGVLAGCDGNVLSHNDPIEITPSKPSAEVVESEGIKVDINASCQQREVFPHFNVRLPAGIGPCFLENLTFSNGMMVSGSKIITPIPSRPNYSKVQFVLQIPYRLTLEDFFGRRYTLTGQLPRVHVNTVVYLPSTRTEFNLNVKIDTKSKLVGSPLFTARSIQMSIRSLIISRITGQVKLVPPPGYNPGPTIRHVH